MADPLYELLIPYFDAQDASATRPDPRDPTVVNYINLLTTRTLSALSYTEPQVLLQSAQGNLRNVQGLSKRSYKPIISSTERLSSIGHQLPSITHDSQTIHDALPDLESSAQTFAQKYSRTIDDNAILDRRKKALLLSRNVDRISDVLDLPTLLSSAISSSSSTATGTANTTSSTLNYASALDLQAHIRRLHAIYPNISLIDSISEQAEEEMKSMTTNLITSLQAQVLKLAGAMRTIGWLRRVAPELDDAWENKQKSASLATNSEGSLGALFLVCRLVNLLAMLEALDPLRELADQETTRRKNRVSKAKEGWAGGQQTERFLKRYIEIFREQSFAIMSMYKSIFPSALPAPGSSSEADGAATLETQPPLDRAVPGNDNEARLQTLPSPLSTFPAHLVSLLMDTLQEYLPNIQDRQSRESLLTQVLYCAGSLGRLGADFSMSLALLLSDLAGDDESDEGYDEWAEVIKKHRVQASRLELLASGVGGGTRKVSLPDRVASASPH